MSLTKAFYWTATSILFIILFLYYFHQIPLDITNSDLGRHLLLGKIIVTSGNVPKINLLSYTNTRYPFINTHWLSELVFYLGYIASGFNGLIVLSVLLITVAFFTTFSFAAKKHGIFPALLVALIYLQVLAERTEVRPELFSFLLLSLFITILYKYKENYTKWIFVLIPLELLWVNFHIYFFVGIIILLLFLFDAFFAKKNALTSKKHLTLLFVTLAAVLATFSNPSFIHGAVYPLFVLNNYGFMVEENMNFLAVIATSHDPTLILFGISVILLWTTLLISIKKMGLIDLLLSFFFTVMGFFAIRDFPLFVFGSYIPFVKATSFVKRLVFKSVRTKRMFWFESSIFSIICILLIPTFIWIMGNHILGFGVIDNTKDAVNFMTNNNIKGPIYNNFDIGNYLEYRLYPKEKVFVDNRPEAYPKDFFENIYFPILQSTAKFTQISNLYKFNVIFYDYNDLNSNSVRFVQQLISGNAWKMIYLDSEIGIFLKNTPSNQQIIRAYGITQNNVKISNADLSNKNKVEQLANFFKNIRWYNPLLALSLHYLSFDPSDCHALENVAYLLQQRHDPSFQLYYNKYIQTCMQ